MYQKREVLPGNKPQGKVLSSMPAELWAEREDGTVPILPFSPAVWPTLVLLLPGRSSEISAAAQPTPGQVSCRVADFNDGSYVPVMHHRGDVVCLMKLLSLAQQCIYPQTMLAMDHLASALDHVLLHSLQLLTLCGSILACQVSL